MLNEGKQTQITIYLNLYEVITGKTQNRKQSKYPSTGEQIKCGISIQWNMEYYPEKKR